MPHSSISTASRPSSSPRTRPRATKPGARSESPRSADASVGVSSVAIHAHAQAASPAEETPHEYDHDQARHADLLHGLGQWTAGGFQSRLAGRPMTLRERSGVDLGGPRRREDGTA